MSVLRLQESPSFFPSHHTHLILCQLTKKHSTLFFLAIKYIASPKFLKASKSHGLCKLILLKVISSLPIVNSLSTAPVRKDKLLNQKQLLKKGGKTHKD